MPHKISVITVSYNSENFIEKYINSVLANLQNGELIILDNASIDKTVEKLERFLPKIKIIKSAENLGFSKGNNKAVKEASGEYLFFLNPDTEINEPIFDQLINFYENTPNAGIVGPKLIMSNGQTQPSVRKLPSVLGAFKEYILRSKNAYSEYVPTGDKPIKVEMVYGAAMLIKKDLFDQVGGFDEKFFLYYEDADLCRRVRKLGKKIYYYPKVSIKHLVGGSKSDQNRQKLNYKSSVIYHGLIGSFFLQIIFRLRRLFG